MTYWRKNLFIMWICQFLAMVGMSSIVPFLPLFVRELGVTDLEEAANWSGLVFAGPFFISFFLAPVWGSLGDKYGRKIMTLRAVFGLALAQVILGFSGNVTHLFIGRLLQGALSGFLPAAMALVAANTPEEKTGYALGLLQSANAAGNVLGPLIGGVVSDLIGFRNVFFFVAGLVFISGLLVLFFVKEEMKVEGNEKYSFMQNWKYLLQKKSLLIPSLMITLAALGVSFVRPIFVFYVETLKINTSMLPTITGALYSIVGIFSIISAAWWGRRVEKTGLKKNLIYASLITALAGVFLEQFNASAEGGDVRLEWKTGEESNLVNFIIERKTPQTEFIDIATVKPKGSNSFYSYIDKSAYKTNGMVFIYRLKSIDKNQQITRSEQISVSNNISDVKRTWGSIKAMFR